MSEKTKKKYTNLGVMCLAKKKDPTNKDEPKIYYLKLEQQTTKDGKPYGEQVFPITLANGKQLNSGDILSLYSKKEKFAKMVEDGKMEQDKANFLSSFLLFDIVLTEEVNEGSAPTKKGNTPNF